MSRREADRKAKAYAEFLAQRAGKPAPEAAPKATAAPPDHGAPPAPQSPQRASGSPGDPMAAAGLVPFEEDGLIGVRDGQGKIVSRFRWRHQTNIT